MENGINLASVKYLFNFPKMPEEDIAAVSSKKPSLPEDPVEGKSWKFQGCKGSRWILKKESPIKGGLM